MSGYRCIMADPPWPVRWAGTNRQPDGRGSGGYDFASVPEITEIMREQIIRADPDCHLWLWATTGTLPQALDVMRDLGFRYVSNLAWVKFRRASLQIGLGHYLRNSHELCLLGVRGKTQYPTATVPSVVFAQRTRHSRKPDGAYRVIEQASPGPRLSLFDREQREGWTVWGDEIPSTIESTKEDAR